MALIECPDCGKQISDAASSCIGCGRPMHHVSLAPQQPVDDANKHLKCPVCRGVSVRRYAVLYDESRTKSTTVTTGSAVGLLGGQIGVGVGSAESRGYSISELAGRLAPPVRKNFNSGGFFNKRAREQDESRFRSALEEWNRKYLCLQCGTSLLVNDFDSEPEILDGKADPVLDDLIRQGQIIQAVKYVRETTGQSLVEAKNRVDARARELR